MRRAPRLAAAALLPVVAVAGCSKPKPPDPAALVEKLKSTDEAVSGAASLDLIRLGEPGVPALVELLKDAEPSHRALAARTFWGMGARAGAAAAALGEALADGDASVRVGAAMALENMGPAAAPAVAALTAALVTNSGKSAWFVGVLLMMVYAIFAMTLYLLPPRV